MKVENLIKVLQENLKPTDDICVLWWEKPDYEEDLSDEVWEEVCSQFDAWEDAGVDISEWIADAIIENAETEH